MEAVYEQCRQQELVHTGFMKAQGQVYETGTGLVMDLTVDQEALLHAEHFMFHPTLLDGSGIGSGRLFFSLLQGEPRLYLPLFFESFCASHLLQTHCFTRIQSSSVRMQQDLISMTLAFFNASGHQVAELTHFSSKLVRGAHLINPMRRPGSQPASSQVPAPPSLSAEPTPPDPLGGQQAASSHDFERLLCQLLAQRLGMPIEQIQTQMGYYQMGLDSAGLLHLVKTLASRLGVRLSPTLFF